MSSIAIYEDTVPPDVATSMQISEQLEPKMRLGTDSSIETRELRTEPSLPLSPPSSAMTTESISFFDLVTSIERFRFRMYVDALKRPWLPKSIHDLLQKMRSQALSESEAVALMTGLASRATEHYRLSPGKFVAISFGGRVVETADAELELLERIQGKHYTEQVFVWKVGSESFTGWGR